MGSVLAKNTVDNAVESIMKACNDTAAELNTTAYCDQSLVIEGSSHITLGKVKMKCITIQEGKSLVTSENNTKFDNSISETIDQLAKTINQNFNMNPGSTKANNTVKLVTKLGTEISNTFKNICSSRLVSNQMLKIKDSDHIKAATIDFSTLEKSTLDCVGESKSVSDAKNVLEQHVSQSAKSTVQNAIFWILLAVAACMLAFGYMESQAVTGGAKAGGSIFGGSKAGGSKAGGSIFGESGHLIFILLFAIAAEIYLYYECSGKIKIGKYKILHWCKTTNQKYMSMGFVAVIIIALLFSIFKKIVVDK